MGNPEDHLLGKAVVRELKAEGVVPTPAVFRAGANEAGFILELSFEAVPGIGSMEKRMQEGHRPSRRRRSHNGQAGFKGLFQTWLVQGAEMEGGEPGINRRWRH